MSGTLWRVVVAAAIFGAGVMALRRFAPSRERTVPSPSPVPSPTPAPAGEAPAETEAPASPEEPESDAAAFFALPRDERLRVLAGRIDAGDMCWPLDQYARRAGRHGELHELWLDLFERASEFLGVGGGLDLAGFKEQLLYLLRDGLEPDSPLLDRLVAAYRLETHSFTRLRMVRAVGRVGGRRAQEFLAQVLQEGDGLASQEAERWLRR